MPWRMQAVAKLCPSDGIYGANCRHSHGPYIPGMPRAYHPDPEHPSGLTNEEVYELTQEQRRRERGIRAAKRELRGAQLAYEHDPSPANLAEVNRAKQKLRNRQEGMRGFIEEANGKCSPGTAVLQRSPRREWAGDMPKDAVPRASGRTLKDTLGSPSVQRRIEKAGTSTTAVRRELGAALKADGLDGHAWRFLGEVAQREYLGRAIQPRYPGRLDRKPAEWRNPEVAALTSKEAVRERFESKHGVIAQPSFDDLTLEQQKAALAGFEHAKAKYGKPEAGYITSLPPTARDDGQYDTMTGKILVSPKTKDAWVTAVHETVHAIDAEKSSRMPKFANPPGEAAHNLHSKKVLEAAKRELGLKKNSRDYRNQLMEIFDNDPELFFKLKDNHGEIAAYAIDHEESGRGNELTAAIARRF